MFMFFRRTGEAAGVRDGKNAERMPPAAKGL